MLHETILTVIGNTPCVRLRKLAPEQVSVYVKLEGFNPCLSQKDRLALAMIDRAEEAGMLSPGQTLVEASNGQIGVALAMVCAQKGYPLVVVMPADVGPEKRQWMRAMGAKVVLTPAEERERGAAAKACELATAHRWFWLNSVGLSQSEDLVAEHLGRELLRDFASLPLDYCVTAAPGKGLTSGLRSLFQQMSPGTQVVACQVARQAAPLAPGEDVAVSPLDAARAMQDLASQEGIVTGLRGGAALAATLQIAAQAVSGSHIVCVLPDAGERSPLSPSLDRAPDSMNAEEQAISKSTAGQQIINKTPRPLVQIEDEGAYVADVAQKLLEQIMAESEASVLIFAYEWCEMGWAVRKLFDTLDIRFTCVNLDDETYQVGQVGAGLKAALVARTGITSMPQIFVHGEFIGSCMELFDSVNNRTLFRRLDHAQVPYNHVLQLDPYALLPGWAQTSPAEVRAI